MFVKLLPQSPVHVVFVVIIFFFIYPPLLHLTGGIYSNNVFIVMETSGRNVRGFFFFCPFRGYPTIITTSRTFKRIINSRIMNVAASFINGNSWYAASGEESRMKNGSHIYNTVHGIIDHFARNHRVQSY